MSNKINMVSLRRKISIVIFAGMLACITMELAGIVAIFGERNQLIVITAQFGSALFREPSTDVPSRVVRAVRSGPIETVIAIASNQNEEGKYQPRVIGEATFSIFAENSTKQHRKLVSNWNGSRLNTDTAILMTKANRTNTAWKRQQTQHTHVEDILSMKPPELLGNFRNPCWVESGTLRCLPYFHIFGVCKAGTTDLYYRISRHHHVATNRGIMGKETWYWSWRRFGLRMARWSGYDTMKWNDFISMFPSSTLSSVTERRGDGTTFYPVVTGHGDPMDFWDGSSWRLDPRNNATKLVPDVTTAALIKHMNPNIKLILLLREPVERLFSHYLHGRYGRDAKQFHNDVVTSVRALKECARNINIRACLYSMDLRVQLKVPISASIYSIHLHEWLKVFPRKQIYILRYEDYTKNIADSLQKIYIFLGLDPISPQKLKNFSRLPRQLKTWAKTRAGKILPETRQILQDVFQPYNRQLADMLGDEAYLWNDS